METAVSVFLLSVVVSLLQYQTDAARKCNGMEKLCFLHIDEVTFPGTHNSYSGFNGHLYHWSGSHASSMHYRNQGWSITRQLDYGIRYFDIDTCWVKVKKDGKYWSTGAWACHGKAYAGRIRTILQQMDQWLRQPAHSNEVILIDFNRDVQKGSMNRRRIYEDILKDLKALWEPTRERLQAKELAISTKTNPFLIEAIETNQRIFVYMSEKLLDNASSKTPPWIQESEYAIKITWPQISRLDKRCSSVVSRTERWCKKFGGFGLLRLDIYMTSYFHSTWSAQRSCDRYMQSALKKCYVHRERHGATVNMVIADWVDRSKSPNSVIAAARAQNLINIKKYFGKRKVY